MKINYHIHTSFSGDMQRMNRLDETIEKCAKAAIEKGLNEICFTDHLIIGYPRTIPAYSNSMDHKRLPEYFGEIARVAKKYPKIRIRAGIEVDWLPEKAEEIKAALEKYPFDCVIGSVHLVNGIKIKAEDEAEKVWGTLSEEEIYERHAAYYRAVQEMAKSGICDIVAHLDFVKTDNFVPKRSTLPLIEDTIKAISKNDLCIEVNTIGLRCAAKQIYPTLEILKLCKKAGIPVTIGTDAHKAERLDLDLDEGMKMIKDAGYTELAVFEKRMRSFVKI